MKSKIAKREFKISHNTVPISQYMTVKEAVSILKRYDANLEKGVIIRKIGFSTAVRRLDIFIRDIERLVKQESAK